MTVEKTQENLSTTLEKTEQALGGIENSLGNNEETNLLVVNKVDEKHKGSLEGLGKYITKIPCEWRTVLLVEISKPKQWKTISTKNLKDSGYVVYGANGKIGFYDEFTHEHPTVMITCRGATCGNIHVSEPKAYINGNAMAIDDLSDSMTLEFLKYGLLARKVEDTISGSAQPQITRQGLASVKLPLPPLAEQTVIAQTLDTLLAQVDNIKTRLDAIPKILKTFRQSVLAAAVSGKLTEEWRGENECETPEVSHDSKLPRLDADDLYSTTIDGWIWTRLGSVSKLINGDRGKNYPNKSEYVEKGIPFINTGHIDPNGTLSDERMNYISEEKYNSLGGGKVEPSDLVYCLRGATMGKTARVNYDIGAIASSLVIVRAGRSLNRDFTYYFLVGPESKKLIKNYDNGSAQPNLSAKSLASYPIQLPPIEEQTQIVHRVEELFTFADQIEQQVKNAQGRVNNLTQSILAKAFRGELTAQWRADNLDLISDENSAEALLAKIQEERDALKQKAKPKKKTALKKAVNKK